MHVGKEFLHPSLSLTLSSCRTAESCVNKHIEVVTELSHALGTLSVQVIPQVSLGSSSK